MLSENKVKEHMDTTIPSFTPVGNPASSHFKTNLQASMTQILGMVNKVAVPGVQCFSKNLAAASEF